MLSPTTVDNVRDLPLETVIGKYVELKKSGSGLVAKSPFVDEKSGSFHVSPSKGCWKCFSSGFGGADGISFVMRKFNYGFIDAVKEIADKFQIRIEYSKEEDQVKYLKKVEKIRSIEKINSIALEYFTQNYENAPEAIKKRAPKKVVEELNLGYAPDEWQGLINYGKEQGISVQEFIDAKLVRQNEQGKTYDFFRGRVMFPIFSERGTLIGFSGRNALDGIETSKVINSVDSETYSKSESLLGIHYAKEHIIKAKQAYLVEGNYDWSSMIAADFKNTVSNLGTALTPIHARILKRYCSHIIILGDLDENQAGKKFIEKSVPILLKEGFTVQCVFPDVMGKDPDDIIKELKYKHDKVQEFIDEKIEDAIEFLANFLFENANTIPEKTAAKSALVNLIACIADPELRKAYVNEFKSYYKLTIQEVDTKLSVEKLSEKSNLKEASGVKNLPDHISEDQIKSFAKHWFYADHQKGKGNFGLHFKNGEIATHRSNCIIKPIFEVETQDDNRRIVELENESEKKIIELNNMCFVSKAELQKSLSKNGNFWFHGNAMDYQRFTIKLMGEFTKASLIRTLGWQRAGFYAFADGIFTDSFKKIDSNGICSFKDKEYFLPAFSAIYAQLDEEDDQYESDRYFVWKPSSVKFAEWAAQLYRVHEMNGYWSILHMIACIYRDFIFSAVSYFPHLFLFGQVQTGKSACARSINSVFVGDQIPFNLASGTNVAFTRRLSRVRNGCVWMDEYNNEIDPKRFDAIKGAFDGAGHEKGIMSRDNRTETTKVNSGMIISGQYLPTKDGNSLFTRCIVMYFDQKAEKRSNADVEEFYKLKKWESQGLSHLIGEIIEHRTYFTERFDETFQELITEIKTLLHGKIYKQRVLDNYCILIAIRKILDERIEFPVSYEETYKMAIDGILKQSSQISESDELSEFWKIVESLTFKMQLRERDDYDLKMLTDLTVRNPNGEMETLKFAGTKEVMYLRFNTVHSEYMIAHRQKHSTNGIKDQSIKQFMKSSDAYLGSVKSYNFNGTKTSAYAFDYDLIPVRLKTYISKSDEE